MMRRATLLRVDISYSGPWDRLDPAEANQVLGSFLRVIDQSGLRRDCLGELGRDGVIAQPFSEAASEALMVP